MLRRNAVEQMGVDEMGITHFAGQTGELLGIMYQLLSLVQIYLIVTSLNFD